ncbi:MAG: uracil-DNA glycosylase family protein [Ginsengibacter sp.]
MKTFAQKIISFNKKLEFEGALPTGIRVMNPFKENKHATKISDQFYLKYYSDTNKRHLILGINPGRFGAGVTGIPFTDTKRLKEACGFDFPGVSTHEPSATFIYDMIKAYGGVEKFYSNFYIHSVFPLGITSVNTKGKEVNYNYYDSKELTEAVYDDIIENIKTQIRMGIATDLCYCFGTGKNEKFLKKINDEFHFFEKIIALEHPRYIMQYKYYSRENYIEKYLKAFNLASGH